MKIALLVVYLLFGFGALLLGAVVLAVPTFLGPVPTGVRFGFGALVMAYGLFRIYTAIRVLREPDQTIINFPASGQADSSKPD